MGEAARVAVRVRPAQSSEADKPRGVVISLTPPSITVQRESPAVHKTFLVDHVFTPPGDGAGGATQAQIYNQIGAGLLSEALAGVSGCIVAAGESGTGKSHSILGFGDEPGLIPHITAELLHCINACCPASHRIWCSYLEIQQDRLRDLLRPDVLQTKQGTHHSRRTAAHDTFSDGKDLPLLHMNCHVECAFLD